MMTPLGHGTWPTFRALLEGKTLGCRIPSLPEAISEVDLVRALGGVSFAQHTGNDPSVDLAERAAREACDQAGVSSAGLPMWIGSSKGAVTRLSDRLGAGHALDEISTEIFAAGPHAYVTQQLMKRLGTAAQSHHVAACASSLLALDAARRALVHRFDTDAAPYALVLTSEAALTPAFIHSYQRLGVLSEPTPTTYTQRPFHAQRNGFMLAQAGAAVLLRRLSHGETPAKGEIELVDTATASEATHLIRSSPRMAALEHIAQRLIGNRAADVLHPHAPGTPGHDPRELSLLLKTNGNTTPMTQTPSAYACKGSLGHALGAAGLVSLVLSWMCLRTGKVPPMPWLDEPMATDRPIDLATGGKACDRQGTHAIFAAGFGGHTAGAVLRGH